MSVLALTTAAMLLVASPGGTSSADADRIDAWWDGIDRMRAGKAGDDSFTLAHDGAAVRLRRRGIGRRQ